MITITLTALQLRLVAHSISNKFIHEVGKLAIQLSQLVTDDKLDTDLISVDTNIDMIVSVYSQLTEMSSEVDSIRRDMKTSLFTQIMTNKSITDTKNDWDELLSRVTQIETALTFRLDQRIEASKSFLISLR